MPWIKSPAWDLAWVLNALWMAPLVLVLAWGHDDVRASAVDVLFFALAVPLWFGHRVGIEFSDRTANTFGHRTRIAIEPRDHRIAIGIGGTRNIERQIGARFRRRGVDIASDSYNLPSAAGVVVQQFADRIAILGDRTPQ